MDKVFADWQKKPESIIPHLDNWRKLAPFDSSKHNKYPLTNISPAKTLDFESNLCYCYDCDIADISGLIRPVVVGLLAVEVVAV